MLAKVVILTCFLFGTVTCQSNLDDLISDIFNMTSSSPSPNIGPNTSPNIGPNTNALIGCSGGQNCVPLYLCKNGRVIKDGETLIDIRFDSDAPHECPSLQTCCTVDNTITDPIIIPKPNSEGCGYRNIDGVGFKIMEPGHQETQYGEFPWMVAVLREEIAGNQILNIYQCGGSLIHPSVVLTAAHCVDARPVESIKVRAGEWDTQSKSEVFDDQDRDVVDKIVHKDYYRGGLFNDIALLFVSAPFTLADNIKPICLPPADTNFDHLRCFATGWGKDTFGQNGQYQVILKKIDLPVVPRDTCESTLRTTRLGPYFELHESFICAGGEQGKDTCKGDGGSPLVCPIAGSRNRFYQAGIVAWGIGCGEPLPAAYASISHLRPWIDEQLSKKRIDSSHYTP